MAALPREFSEGDDLAQTGPVQIGPAPLERRRSHREQIVALGRLHAIDPSDRGQSFQVLVTNLSLNGCGLRCAQSPRQGALYQLDLQVGPLELHSRLRVIRAFPRADGTTELGCEFI